MALAGASVLGQRLPAPRQPVAGLVCGADGQPVAGALVAFHPTAAPTLAWAEAWAMPRLAPITTTTDGAGEFRLPGATSAGCLLITGGDRGAWVPFAAPGSPRRVDLEPMGRIRLRAPLPPGRRAELWALRGDEPPCPVGELAAGESALPAASYRLLLHGGGPVWQAEHRLEPNGVWTVAEPRGAVRRLRLPPEFRGFVTLPGWPGSALRPQDGELAFASTGEPRELRVHWQVGDATALAEVWLPPGSGTTAVSPPEVPWQDVTVVGAGGAPAAGARVDAVRHGARGPQLVSTAVTGADGRARAAAADDLHVVVHRRGSAYRVAPAGAGDAARIALQPGLAVDVAVRRPDGSPASGLVVVLEHAAHPLLRCRGRTDLRGRLRFGGIPAGVATLRLAGAEHVAAARQIAVAAAAAGHVWTLTADPGATLLGRVVRSDGSAAAGATVTLRDTTGLLQDPPRTAHADSEGRFRFRGVDPDELYTISAAIEHQGLTWSAQRRAVQPTDTEWLLELELEDPLPPHQRRR